MIELKLQNIIDQGLENPVYRILKKNVRDYVEKEIWEEVGRSVYNPLRSIVMKHIREFEKKK